MEPLITVKDVAERYKCSLPTARKYIRECNPHMEKPLSAYERDFTEWEHKRMQYRVKKMTKKEYEWFEKALKYGSPLVPRSRT